MARDKHSSPRPPVCFARRELCPSMWISSRLATPAGHTFQQWVTAVKTRRWACSGNTYSSSSSSREGWHQMSRQDGRRGDRRGWLTRYVDCWHNTEFLDKVEHSDTLYNFLQFNATLYYNKYRQDWLHVKLPVLRLLGGRFFRLSTEAKVCFDLSRSGWNWHNSANHRPAVSCQ